MVQDRISDFLGHYLWKYLRGMSICCSSIEDIKSLRFETISHTVSAFHCHIPILPRLGLYFKRIDDFPNSMHGSSEDVDLFTLRHHAVAG
jgi:hypothetical protein